MARSLIRVVMPLRWWVAAWALLTIASAALHHTLWSEHSGSQTLSPLESLGNAVSVLTAPGWILVWMSHHSGRTHDVLGPLVGDGIGWAFVIGALWIGRQLARRLVSSALVPGAVVGPPDSSRRRFLFRAPTAVVAMGGGGALARGTFVDPWDLQLRRYRVGIRDLPPGLDGLRIAHLCDTHLGPRVPAAFIERAVRMAMGLEPDLFALTGDYVEGGRAFIKPVAELLRPLVETGRPVVAVLGNHDWYAGGRAMSAALLEIGAHVVDNRRVWLDGATRRILVDPPASNALCIAGLGDLLTDLVDLPGALSNLPAHMPRLVLTHEPDVAEAAAGRAQFRGVVGFPGSEPPRIDLMLCGHTHGGQVSLPLIGAPFVPGRFGFKYAGGLVQAPGFPVVVSRGVGMSTWPIRLGVPPEVVEITLERLTEPPVRSA